MLLVSSLSLSDRDVQSKPQSCIVSLSDPRESLEIEIAFQVFPQEQYLSEHQVLLLKSTGNTCQSDERGM